MAQVSFDPVPSVLPTALPDNYDHVQATPSDFGAQVGEAVGRLGSSLGQASDTAAQIALVTQQSINATNTNNNLVNFQKALDTQSYGDPNDPSSKGYFALNGAAAVNGLADASAAAEKARTDLMANMSPAAARMFDVQSRRMLDQTISSYSRYSLGQQKAWQDQSAQDALSAQLNTAILNRNDPSSFNQALANTKSTVATWGKQNGWSDEQIQNQITDAQSKLNLGVLKAKAIDNPIEAWNFYKQNQQHFTGTDQMEAETLLKPSVMASQATSDANTIMSGTAGNVSQAVSTEATHQGVDPGLALTTAKIESGMGVRLKNPNSQASGVFGMMPGTWQQQGGGNPNDVGEQVRVGVKNLADSTKIADDTVGGNAQPWQVYIVHQQGAAGGPALLKADPNSSAVDALTPAYKGNKGAAEAAIVSNGGSANMSAGQFLSMWQQRYAAAAGTVSAPGASGGEYEAAVGTNAGTGQPLPPSITPGSASDVASSSPSPTSSAAPGVPTSANPGDHLNDWLGQANGITDPFGQNNPEYQRMVASAIRAKTAAIQQQQAQEDRQSKSTLLTAALGITGATGGVSGAPTVPAPTSLDQLLSTPATKAAWANASADTRQAIMGVVEKNSTAGPPITPEVQTKYYSLLAESTQHPDAFLKENLADSQFLSEMPRGMVSSLMSRQADIDGKTQTSQQRQMTMSHARDVVAPDLLLAGINTRLAATNPAVAQTYNDFMGRLDEAMQSFQTANKTAPNDDQIKAIGRSLLTPGTLRGSGSLWGLLPNDTSTSLFQAATNGTLGRFAPTVPAADRQQIIQAYGTRNKGAVPTEAQIQGYYLAGRQPVPPAPGQPPQIQSKGSSPFAGPSSRTVSMTDFDRTGVPASGDQPDDGEH